MNKLAIPTILVATVLVAGMFAFMPVQKAQTVHTTIQASIRDSNTITEITLAAGTKLVLFDNAGIGGTSDVEVAWRFSDTDCSLEKLVGGTLSAIANDNALDTPLGDTSLAHGDVTGADAVVLRAAAAAVCTLAPASGDFVTVSAVKGS